MSSTTTVFKKLHQQQKPFLLGNVWDAKSAKIYEGLQYKAIGTSSAAASEALGYQDGENMPFDEYFFVIKRIKASTSLPFTVDMEGGYGNTAAEVVSNIKKLAGIGVAGINIEDSAVKENLRSIIPGSEFAQKLSAICTQLKKEQVDVFINVRCDAFLLDLAEARQEALARIASYEKAGADGIFLPCITDPEDIGAAVNATKLPLNVMCMPNLPDFDTLQSLGVKRISMGNFVNGAVYKHLEEISGTIARQKNFSAVFQ